MSTLSRMQQIALAGSVGATIAAGTVLGASGSTAAPMAASHSAAGPQWYGATTYSTLIQGAESSTTTGTNSAESTVAGTASPSPSSTAAATTVPSPATTYGGKDPEFVDITAVPGPCTQDDIAASRWSTRVTVTNPADAGPLDYMALAINFTSESDDINDYPHAGPLHLAAGETGSIVLTGPSDYFPDSIVVGGGISSDGETAKAIGEVDVFDQETFLQVAKVCGNTTPTQDPGYSDPTSTDVDEGGSSGYAGDPAPTRTVTRTKTVTATVTVTQTVRGGEPGEPPTPSPITTRLGVTG